MIPKILHWLGLVACITLIVSCFLPWAYYADIDKTFTGLFSFENRYGRPGKLLILLTSIIFVFMLLPKVWARRANLFLCALCVGYALKTYVLFTACYMAYCPEKKIGIYLMVVSVFLMLAAAVFPDLKLRENRDTDQVDMS
ncbi:hypothetical protein ACQ33O_12750 [Ferruginibacter sp. SUN002]|uniref:hypothetical protein n=1 Tax=Ferruginibacter sp. SUN002 TaxID=2937789 RepID=UPI003D36358D